MNYLHIWSNEKFADPYIQFINKHFEKRDHLFLIIGREGGAQITPSNNVVEIPKNIVGLSRLIKEMYQSDKIYLHSLFIMKVVMLLFLQPWLLKKCNWIVWGGDLYYYLNERKTIKAKIKEVMRRFVIKNMGGIITLVKGDYDLAKKWYGVKGKYYHGIYINPIKLEYLDELEKSTVRNKQTINIQIGNSAALSNKHLEVLHLLRSFKDEDINIYVPLSYGDPKYAQEVIKFGYETFGDRFKPLLDFLKPEEYSQYLSSIDIAIFAHERQQALGNIFALLYLGKKVYIRSDVSTWGYLKKQLDLDISNYLEINNQGYSEFISLKNNKSNNKEKVKLLFNHNYIKEVWKKIF